MRRYLEEIVTKVIPEQSEELIKEENERIKIYNELKKNDMIEFLMISFHLDVSLLYSSLIKSNSLDEFLKLIKPNVSENLKKAFECLSLDKDIKIVLKNNYNEAKELIQK